MRTFVFWTHLLVGVAAGLVICFMSVTGVLLAFEPQITEWLERDRRMITPPPGTPRLSVEALLARAREARPDQRPGIVTLRSDPTASAVVSFGRESCALFIDPYRGTVLGGLSPAHDFLHEVVEWHRWLGSRDTGRPITGAANLGFLGLVLLGVYLLWPRRWTRETVRRAMLFDGHLRGRARDFNWHNVIGIWCAPVLLVVTLTGLVMSYQWANNLLFTLTGNEAPPPAERQAPPARPGQGANRPAARRDDSRACRTRRPVAARRASGARLGGDQPPHAGAAGRPTRLRDPGARRLAPRAALAARSRCLDRGGGEVGALRRPEPRPAAPRLGPSAPYG
jgi:uncharacterized iron-regulated membrane protein